jgi:hypothetical protein
MSKKTKIVLWPLLVAFILVLAVVTLARRTISRSLTADHVAVGSVRTRSVASTTAQQLPIPQIEAELITILPRGFEPNEIRRPAGKFILAIDNRSGLAEVNLTLVRLGNGRVMHEARIRKEKLDFREVVDLRPGDYRLSETGHPAWEARLIITER